MKVLITGATGTIGSGALTQCLAHPQITSVIAFTRRPLPTSISTHPKLQTVLVADFSTWTPDLLDQHMDAAAMIWSLGSLYGDRAADYAFPLEFQRVFIKRRMELEASSGVTVPAAPFTHVQVSGKFVRQDQDERLFFLEFPRKLKGLLETHSIALAEETNSWWRLVIVRPGGVMSDGFGMGVLTAVLGENWAVNVNCLGAYLAYLAVGGEAEGPIVYTQTIARKGKELLAAAGAT